MANSYTGSGAYRNLTPEGVDSVTAETLYQTIERPKEASMGDYACPCFRLQVSQGRKNCWVIAEALNQANSE